jgi:hypothetical protein
MPFPDLITAGMVAREDSSKFIDERVDSSIQYQTEGGVYLSRPRFTRDPGRVITTGFTYITEADYQLLDAYYTSMRGGSLQFSYTHPTSNVTLQVRFLKPYKAQYVGMGGHHHWDINDLQLQTV